MTFIILVAAPPVHKMEKSILDKQIFGCHIHLMSSRSGILKNSKSPKVQIIFEIAEFRH